MGGPPAEALPSEEAGGHPLALGGQLHVTRGGEEAALLHHPRPGPPQATGVPLTPEYGGGGRGTGGGTAVPEGVWGGGWTVKPGPGPIQVNGGDALVGRQVGTGRLGRLGGPFHMGSGMGLGEEYQKVLGVAIVGVGYHLRAPSRKARQYFDTLIRGFSPA